MQSTISSTEFYEGKEITLTAEPDEGANDNLFYWVINFTTNDLQYSIQELGIQGKAFKPIRSSGIDEATGTVTVTQQANSINTLTPLLLQVPMTKYIGTATNTALNSNAFFADTGTTYNITWVNPPAQTQKTITGIVTWLRNWFNTKEEIDEMILTDSGWQTCTLSSGYAVYTSGTTLRVRKVGKIVHATGVFKNNNTLSASSNVQFATLPSGYRPSQEQVKICQGSDAYKWLLRIKTDGAMTLSRYGTSSDASASSGRWLPYCITYMVD